MTLVHQIPARFVLVTAPASEPVTSTEMKAHLRVESAFTADDELITLLGKTAREMCEAYLDRSFINTTWDYVLDAFPMASDRLGDFIPIPKADLASVTSVSYVDTSGTTQTLVANTDYRVLTGAGGGIYPAAGATWPTTDDERRGAVTIRFVAGYGSSASSVPSVVKAAILVTLTHLYEHRGDGANDLPPTAAALLGAARWGVL